MTDVKAELLESGDAMKRRLLAFVGAVAEMTNCGPDVDAVTRYEKAVERFRAESQPALPEGAEARRGFNPFGTGLSEPRIGPATPLPTGRALDEDLKIIGTMVAHYCDNDQFYAWERILASLGGVDKGALRPSEGAAVVPKEPTEDMLDAADDAFHAELQKQRAANRRAGRPLDAYGSGPVSEAIYRAMIAAAPDPQGSGVNQNPEESR